MSLRTRRTWRPKPPPGPPAGIGHNQGPPLDAWNAFCWRRARKAAWKSAPTEVVRRRCNRARDLGLSYQDYTAVILDWGVHVEALVFGFGGTLVEVEKGGVRTDPSGRIRPLPGVIEKLSGLKDCKVFVMTDQAEAFVDQINGLCNAVLADTRTCSPQPGPLSDLLAGHGLSPSAAVMIGDRESDRRCAEAARLARFIWARDYFGWS